MNILKEILLNQLIRLPFVQKLAKKGHSTGRNNNIQQVQSIYDKLCSFFEFHGKSALELGPGQTFGILEKALNEGKADKVSAVDISTYLEHIPERISFKQYDGTKIPFEDENFDILWTWSVFEHIRFPNITVPETYRVLKKGGRALHSIDLVDHFNYTWQNDKKIFNCLKYSEWLWNAMTWNRSNYVNRLRLSAWLELFQAQGFKIIHIETVENKTVNRLYIEDKIDYLKKYSLLDAITSSVIIVVEK